MTLSADERNLAVLQGALDAGEKRGFRQLPSPIRLSPLHRQILFLHIHGRGYSHIARELGVSNSRVSNVIRSPAAQELLTKVADLHKLELAALTAPALESIRRNLESTNGNVALKAADMVLSTQGLYKEAERATTSAEDVIQRMLELTSADGTKLRMVEQIGHRETEVIPTEYPEGGNSPAERGHGPLDAGQDSHGGFEHDAPGEVQ